MKKIIPIKKENFNKAAINLINCFLNMSDYEINIIVGMLDYNIKSLNTATRAQLVELLKLKPMSFNNYIKKLKDKGVLTGSKDLTIHPNITSMIEDNEVNITLFVHDQNN